MKGACLHAVHDSTRRACVVTSCQHMKFQSLDQAYLSIYYYHLRALTRSKSLSNDEATTKPGE